MSGPGPFLAATLRLQAIEGHGPRCLDCAAVRREAAELDLSDRAAELGDAEAAHRGALADVGRVVRAVERARRERGRR
ncbi:MAG: hypothetical protein IPM35_16990 [Myxococcales bacterium]|nr:hypothetical protein [Myxococcales bacterium]